MDQKEDRELSTIARKVKILKDPSQTGLRFCLNTGNCGEDSSYCNQPLVKCSFGWPFNTGSSNVMQRPVKERFMRHSRDCVIILNFVIMSRHTIYRLPSIVGALIHAFWHSPTLFGFSNFYCPEPFLNKTKEGFNKTGFMEYEWQTWINFIVTINDFYNWN